VDTKGLFTLHQVSMHITVAINPQYGNAISMHIVSVHTSKMSIRIGTRVLDHAMVMRVIMVEAVAMVSIAL